MKYMLMMNTPGNGPYQIAAWPKQDIEAHIAFMIRFAKQLRESGELVSAEGLSGPDQAKLVRAGASGSGAPSDQKSVASVFLGPREGARPALVTVRPVTAAAARK